MSEISIARSRLKLVTILGFFLVPLFVAVIGYFYFPGWFTSAVTVNNAPLVQPVITLKPFTNLKLDETQLTLDSIKRKWTVVHLLNSQCNNQCETALYNSRQVRLALGKDSDRVQRVIIGSDVRLLESAAKDHPDLSIVLGIQGGLEHQLESTVDGYNMKPEDALLIDPLGNVMMLIPADLNPTKLLKDLKKLLKLSKIG